jgi:hypothetical protein
MHQSSCQRVGDTPTEKEVIGWQIIRKFYEGKYFSSGTINILLSSWREATSRQYHICLLKCYTYCWERNINPFSPCLSAVLSFLTLLFSTGIGFSALNTARSAYRLKSDSTHHFFRNACTKSGSLRFSQFSGCWLILSVLYNYEFWLSLCKIVRSSVILLLPLFIVCDNLPNGKHPLARRFLQGAFNHRPFLPRNNVTWDVSIVLHYLQQLWPISNLSLKDLTIKCVMLLALTTGQRAQSIHFN